MTEMIEVRAAMIRRGYLAAAEHLGHRWPDYTEKYRQQIIAAWLS